MTFPENPETIQYIFLCFSSGNPTLNVLYYILMNENNFPRSVCFGGFEC